MDISGLTLQQLKMIVAEQKDILDNAFWQAMAVDSRVGVQRLYQQIAAHKERYEKERARVNRLYEYEVKYIKAGYRLIAGVDEAGRGPLAGPVVAAAVILPEQAFLAGLNDSKKLSAAAREVLYVKIKDIALSFSVEIVSVEEILELNIFRASLLAMRRAVLALDLKPDFVLVDGMQAVQLPYRQMSLVKGDSLSASIAAASILAKVSRDRLMLEYHKAYPVYGFDRHKGYPTNEHKKALTKYGPCPIHRVGFKPVKECCDIIMNNK